MSRKKKLLVVIGVLCLSLVAVACGSSSAEKEEEPAVMTEAERWHGWQLEEDTEPTPDIEENEVMDNEGETSVGQETTPEEPSGPEIIHWTNADIEAIVLEALGKEPGDVVTVEEAATVTGIFENPDDPEGEPYYLWLTNIKDCDMSDLRYLTSLTGVRLADKKLDDISMLEYIPNIQYLEIYSEELTDLSPLTGNTTLESLIVETYGLENLNSLTGMTNLKKLSVTSDILGDVSAVGQLTGLTELYIKSNVLQALGIDFTNMHSIVDIKVDCDVLTDLTCFSTLQSGVTVYNGKVNVRFYNSETSVTEESLWVIGKVRYDSLVLAGQYGYDTSLVDFNDTVNGDDNTYYREWIYQYGMPEVAIIEEWMPEPPSVTIPDTWEDVTIDFDGQLLTVPCSLQSLFDYGYQMEETEIDLTDRMEPEETEWYDLYKDNGVQIRICVTNTDTEQAIPQEDCPVTRIRIERANFDDENLPELFLPTDMQRRRMAEPYGNYISWEDGRDELVWYSVWEYDEGLDMPSTLTENMDLEYIFWDNTVDYIYSVKNKTTGKKASIYIDGNEIIKVELISESL